MEKLKQIVSFNSIITGPTCCGKTHFLIEQLCENFRYVFDYIVLICPTYANNKTYTNFALKDSRFIVVLPEPDSEDEINDIY